LLLVLLTLIVMLTVYC